MMDIGLAMIAIGVITAATALRAAGQPREMRPWFWIALVEYMLAAVAQILQARFEGGDQNYYRLNGIELSKFLDSQFTWTAGELFALLVHQPCAFDGVVLGAGANTGSMSAVAAWIMFLTRGSEFAAQTLIAGLALFATVAVYEAFRDLSPTVSPTRIFAATVLFPSVAFWTSAFHKEAFCVMGIGLSFAAWRNARARRFRALFYGPLGLMVIVMFRAPALPPLLLGIVAYLVVERVQAARGGEGAVVGPAYLAVGFVVLALGMVLVTRIAPELSLDRLSESVATQQSGWRKAGGGSSFDLDEPEPLTVGEQLIRAPVGLLNALLRPQLFDVTNSLVLVSALEMTLLTYMIYVAIRLHGIKGIFVLIQRSPFLLMCTVITVVGCTFVGLTTLNFGSLARYRVPFLPFYGALLVALTQRTATVAAPEASPPGKPPGRKPTGRTVATT